MADVLLRLRVDGQTAVVAGIESVSGALDRNVQATERDTTAMRLNAAAVEQLKAQRALGSISVREYETQLTRLAERESAAAQASAQARAAARARAAEVEKAAAQVEAATRAQAEAAAAAARAQAQEIDGLRTRYDPAYAAAQRLTAEQTQLKRALDTGAISQQRYTELLKAQGTATISVAQQAAALRGVPAQFTDIATSISAGQSPLTVLLQQGGQLKDMFGGAGAAARALGGYVLGLVNPFTAATAAVGAVGFAAYQGSREMDGYRTALTLTGNALGVTAGQMNGMAVAIRASGKATQGAASEALVEMATNGKVGKEQLQAATQAALMWSKATGASTAEVAKNFADLAKDPLGGTLRLNEGMNYLTASTYQQIKALTDQGRTTEAAAVAQKAYYDTMNSRAPELLGQLGYMERGWNAVSGAIKGVWDALKSAGREDTPEQKLELLGRNIDSIRKKREQTGDNSAFAPALDRELSKLQDQQSVLQSQTREMQRGVALSARQAEQSKARAEADKDGLKYLTESDRLKKEIAQETQRLKDAGADPKEINDRIAAIRYKTDLGYMQARLQASQAMRKLDDADAEASVRHQVSTEVLTQEQGIKDVAALRAKALQDQAAEADRLAKATAGRDPLQSAQAAAKAAELRKEAANVAVQAERDLADAAYKSARAVIDASNGVVGSEIGRRQALEESTRATSIQTEQARQHGVVIDSVATILDREKVALYDTALATAEKNLQDQRSQSLTADKLKGYQDAVDLLTRMRDGLKEVTAASEANDLAKAGLDQTNRLKGQADPSAPMNSFGNTLRDALGGASSEMGKMVNAMTTLNSLAQEYSREMAVIEQLRKAGDDKSIETARQNEILLVKKQEQAQIGAYASMAGAAASYFGKQTAGYKALHGAEVALRTYQIVMSAQAAAKDLAAIGARVAAWVTGESVMTQAGVDGSAARASASAAEGAVLATKAVANQGGGDPYTAFPRIAAMAAIMAALGFAVSGGSKSAAAPTNDGTGTVFGSSTAKSESLTKALDILNSTQDQALVYSKAMAASLRSIESALGGLTNVYLRSGGASGLENSVQTGMLDTGLSKFLKANYLTSLDPTGIVSGLVTSLFGKKVSIVGSGITADAQPLQRIFDQGFQGYSYVDVNTKKKAFGVTYSNKTREQRADLDPTIERQITGVFEGIGSSVNAAADLLGQSLLLTGQRLSNYVVDIGRVDLRGLDGKAISEKLSAVFGSQADKIAQAVIPGLEQMQKVGEGYYETLTRVANQFEVVNVYTERLGDSLGQVGLDGAVAADALVQLFGGTDKYTSTIKDYYETYYTEAERNARTAQELGNAFVGLGQQMPSSLQGFRDLVNAQDLTTESGRQAYASLLALSPAFAQVTNAADAEKKEVEDQRLGLQDQLDQLTGNTAARRARELSALDVSNRALQERIWALQDEKAAADAAASAGARIVDFVAKLDSGSLGLATAAQRASAGRQQYGDQLALARSGDKTALESITSTATDYLQAARDSASNQLDYAIQLAQVKSDLALLPAARNYMERLNEDQLKAMTETRDGIIALKAMMTDLVNVNVTQAATLASNTGASARKTEDLLKFWERLEQDGAFTNGGGV